MRDIDAPSAYSRGNESEFRREVNRSIDRCYNSFQDVMISRNQRFALQSPNGTWYRIKVDDAGVLSTEVIVP